MNTFNKATLATCIAACSIVGFVTPALSDATIIVHTLDDVRPHQVSFSPPSLQPGSGPARQPVNLLMPITYCEPGMSVKLCDVRRAAAQRAADVVAGESGAVSMTQLLVPGERLPCNPPLTPQECIARDPKSRPPPGTVHPVPPSPTLVPPNAPSPVPPSDPLPLPPVEPVPPPALAPVPAQPPSVIPPPPTGDEEIVKKPPPSASDMPVIKPPLNPPVVPK